MAGRIQWLKHLFKKSGVPVQCWAKLYQLSSTYHQPSSPTTKTPSHLLPSGNQTWLALRSLFTLIIFPYTSMPMAKPSLIYLFSKWRFNEIQIHELLSSNFLPRVSPVFLFPHDPRPETPRGETPPRSRCTAGLACRCLQLFELQRAAAVQVDPLKDLVGLYRDFPSIGWYKWVINMVSTLVFMRMYIYI